MYKRVVVPLDGSAFAEHAIPYALQIARRTAAEVDLVHVHVPQPDDGLSALTPYQFQQVTSHYAEWDHKALLREMDRLQEKAAALAAETGVSVTSRVVSGQLPDALTGEAESFHADIIVMATHARTGLQRVRFGSVAELVVRQARMPVLLVHPHTESHSTPPSPVYRRILIPLDGSKFSEEVLQPAAAFARLQGAEIKLVHVMKQHDGAWDEYLERVSASRIALGPETCLESIRAARVTDGILEAADRWRADLIALATHGRGGLSRLVVGSTASDLLARTHLPVLLRRPDPSAISRLTEPAVAQFRQS